ncbi:MAG: hypothetical protein SFU84_11165 [Gemmatimonadales bacterium]|nr:hypothetical protein [Gemmatimonadales bacterium]
MTTLNWVFLALAVAGLLPGLYGWLRYRGARSAEWRKLIVPSVGMALASGSLTPAAEWAGLDLPLDLIGIVVLIVGVGAQMRQDGSSNISAVTMLVSVVAMSGTLFLAFPLAELLGMDTTLGLLAIMGILLGGIGLVTTRILNKDPHLGTPVNIGHALLVVFGFTTTLGVMTALWDDRVVGITVLVMSLCGVLLGLVYLRRARAQQLEQ